MSDILTATREELIALVYDLIDRVHAQEAQIAYLKDQLHQKGKDNTPTVKPPVFVKANIQKKKKAPRKKREGSYHRTREVPTQQIFHSFSHCPNCNEQLLGKGSVGYTRTVIELPIVPYQVIEHVILKHWCINCQKRVMPTVSNSLEVIGHGNIGINLASTIVTMRDRLRLPLPVIKTYLKLFYQLDLSMGELTEILHTVAAVGKPQYDNLLDQIRSADSVHADETGGRENGQNGYFWSFSTKNIHYLMYRKSRGKQVVEEVVGNDSEKFNGVLTTDFYAAYNTYTGFHQRCWVHFLRDIHELKQQYRKHPPLNIWAKQVKQLYEEAREYSGPDPTLPIGKALEERLAKQQEFENRLRSICEPYIQTDMPMSTLCARAVTYLQELFVFIRFPNVKPDNNPAERIIRHTVTARKIQGGTRSPKGSETKAILTSLFDSWKLQNLNPLEQCRLLLAT